MIAFVDGLFSITLRLASRGSAAEDPRRMIAKCHCVFATSSRVAIGIHDYTEPRQ
jgi:hypothetical protein